MSSRVRIYFREGPQRYTFHTATKALPRLKGLFQAWAGRGVQVVKDFEGRLTFVKHPLIPDSIVPLVPKDLSNTRLLIWYWQQLPEEVKKFCSLTITRESRSSKWSKSLTNRGIKLRRVQNAFQVHLNRAVRRGDDVPPPAPVARPDALRIGIWR